MGPWGDNRYKRIDLDGIDWAVDTIDGLLEELGHHPATYAIEPVNEPWWSSDLPLLKGFYRRVHAHMKEKAPHLKFVFHDSFHFGAGDWNDMFDDDEDYSNVVMDTHFYTAWWGAQEYVGKYCDGYRNSLSGATDIKYDVWVGEWSLATDVCALWLGGFNDNNTPYAYECEWIDCPYSYIPDAELAVDFDRSADMLGPFGQNTLSTIQKGKCPRDSTHYPEADVMTLGQCATYVMDDLVQGMFMWTFRNELEPRWSYPESYDKGWIKRTDFPPETDSEEFLQ